MSGKKDLNYSGNTPEDEVVKRETQQSYSSEPRYDWLDSPPGQFSNQTSSSTQGNQTSQGDTGVGQGGSSGSQGGSSDGK